LAEYPVVPLIRLNEAFSEIAGNDPAFDRLVEKISEVAGQRQSDGKSGEVLLARAKQKLKTGHPLEAIQYLGRAALKFLKHEYREEEIESQFLIAVGYRDAGLLWSARSACLAAIFNLLAEADETDDIPAQILPALKFWAWIALELGHIPDALCAIEMFAVFAGALPLDDATHERVVTEISDLEMSFGCVILNATDESVSDLANLPDIFDAVGLKFARFALLYRLGHEDSLRKEGFIPSSVSQDAVYEHFSTLANQPLAHQTPRTLLTFVAESQVFTTVVLGVRVECRFQNTDASVALAETILSSIESFLATSLNARVYPFADRVVISILEEGNATEPEYRINGDDFKAEIIWPENLHLNNCVGDRAPQQFFFKFILHLLASIAIVPDASDLMKNLLDLERAPDRALTFAPASISYSRIVERPRSTLANWDKHVTSRFELLSNHPTFDINVGKADGIDASADADSYSAQALSRDLKRHNDVKVDSVINPHLWDKAGWRGVGYLGYGDRSPPVLGLLFEDYAIAAKIFEQWHARFGPQGSDEHLRVSIVQGVSKSNPAHYRVCLCPQVDEFPTDSSSPAIRILSSRIHTMEPETSQNLDRFLSDFAAHGSFFLTAVDLSSLGAPRFLQQHALHRFGLIVMEAWKVDVGSSESFAIFYDDDVIIPPAVKDAPVLKVLEARRQQKEHNRRT
jgi:hypothetical protein